MKSESAITMDGIVVECLRDARFTVALTNGNRVLAHLSGKVRKNFIKIIPEDHVLVELSAYDLTRGRILFRYRN